MRKAILLVTFLGWALFAAGQQSYQWIRADIPFDFQINGQAMQAGSYMFGSNIEKHIIYVKPTNSFEQVKYVQMADFENFCQSKAPIVAFNKIGNQYFFKDLRYPGWGRSTALPSAVERKYEKLAKQQVDVNGEQVGK